MSEEIAAIDSSFSNFWEPIASLFTPLGKIITLAWAVRKLAGVFGWLYREIAGYQRQPREGDINISDLEKLGLITTKYKGAELRSRILDIRYDGQYYLIEYRIGFFHLLPNGYGPTTSWNLEVSSDVETKTYTISSEGQDIWNRGDPIKFKDRNSRLKLVAKFQQYVRTGLVGLDIVNREVSTETPLPANALIDAETEYWYNKAREVADGYKNLYRAYVDALKNYIKLVKDWLGDDVPTWQLKPQIEAAYNNLQYSLQKLKDTYEDVARFYEEHLGKKPTGLPEEVKTTPYSPNELPERRAFDEKTRKLLQQALKAGREALEFRNTISAMKSQYEFRKTQVIREYHDKFVSLEKSIETARKKGDTATVQNLEQTRKLLEDELKKRLTALWDDVKRDYQNEINKFLSNAEIFKNLVDQIFYREGIGVSAEVQQKIAEESMSKGYIGLPKPFGITTR